MDFLTLILFWLLNLIAYGIANIIWTVLFFLAVALIIGVCGGIGMLIKTLRGH